MTACRYEFYLLVLKVSLRHSFASLTRETYLEHSKMKLVCPRDHVIFRLSSVEFPFERILTLFSVG